ncbi:MAG: hypothetical protein WBP16_17240 [Ferruginibacter sp.]
MREKSVLAPSVRDALRRWWWIPMYAGLLCGLLAGLATARAPIKATAQLMVATQAADTQTVARFVQTMLAEIDSGSAYADAAGKLGIDQATLRAQTRLIASPDTLVIQVESRGDSMEEAITVANAIAEAAVASSAARLNEQILQVARTTTQVIRDATLPDPQAERARVNRLGEGLADNQRELIAQSNRVSLLHRASAEGPGGPSGLALALVGMVGGGLLGAAAAVFLLGRRGRIQSAEEVRRLYPRTEVLTVDQVPALIETATPRIATIVVATELGKEWGEATSAALREALDVAEVRGVRILQAAPSRRVLRAHLGDPQTMVVHTVVPKTSRVEELDSLSPTFTERTVLLLEVPRGDADVASNQLAPAHA